GVRRMAAEVELAVKACHRLVGDEEERRARPGDVRLLEPNGMARTVCIAVPCDLLREDLDASAQCRQGMSSRVLAESSQQAAIVTVLGHAQATVLPELLKTWGRQTLCCERGAGRFVEMCQPFAHRASLGERFARAEALGEIREDCIVVTRKAEGLCDLMHGDH